MDELGYSLEQYMEWLREVIEYAHEQVETSGGDIQVLSDVPWDKQEEVLFSLRTAIDDRLEISLAD